MNNRFDLQQTRQALFVALLMGPLCLTALIAHSQAEPKLKRADIQGMSLNVPAGWSSEVTQSNGVAVIALSELPKGDTSADVLLFAVPTALGPDAHEVFKTQMLQQLMPDGVAIAHTPSPSPPPGMPHGTLGGTMGGTPARIGWLSVNPPGQPASLVALFAATPGVYESWGGVGFLVKILDTAPINPGAAAAGPLKLPRRYKGYNKPVLAYLAETLKRQPAQNVLQALSQLNQEEKAALTRNSAFTSQLVWAACQANPRLILDLTTPVTGQEVHDCASNAQQWATSQAHVATLTPQNCDQCDQQALNIAVTFRCDTRRLSKGECDAYIKFRAGQIDRNAATIQRLIQNLGGNQCICGDPGCDC